MTLATIVVVVSQAVQSTTSAAVQTVQQTASVVSMEDSISTLKMQAIFAYATVYVLKYLRNSRYFPLLKCSSSKMNKVVSMFAAFLASQAISYTFNVMTVDEASRVLNIAITFPTTVALMHSIWGWVSQFIFQQGAYKMFILSNEHQEIISKQIAKATGTPPDVVVPPPGIVQ